MGQQKVVCCGSKPTSRSGTVHELCLLVANPFAVDGFFASGEYSLDDFVLGHGLRGFGSALSLASPVQTAVCHTVSLSRFHQLGDFLISGG